MLIRFWVKGYRCFKECAEIDLTDKKNYRFGVECVRGDFLDKMVILGNNNAGKTSFGFAITDIISTAGGLMKDIGQRNEACFLNKDSGTDRATFHYELTQRGSVIVYEYSKSSPDRILTETLLVDRQPVYSYDITDGSEPYFNEKILGLRPDVVPDGSKSAILMLTERYRLPQDSPVEVVHSFATHSLYYMAMWKMDVHIGLIDEQDDAEKFVIDKKLLEDFKVFLHDSASVDLELGAENGRLMVIKENGTIPYRDAVSRGTMILLRLFCWIKRCQDRDAILFFDDFDDMFHYRAAENAIR